jgi:hypothetical protein
MGRVGNDRSQRWHTEALPKDKKSAKHFRSAARVDVFDS